MSAAAWVLCTVIDWHTPSLKVCKPEPNEATCTHHLKEWIWKSSAWELRSGIHSLTAVAACGPPEVIAAEGSSP